MAKDEFVSMRTPLFRASWVKVWRPSGMKPDTPEDKKRYSVGMIFDPKDPKQTDAYKKLWATADKVATAAFGKGYREKIRGFKWPFHPGKEYPENEECQGMWVANARSKKKPDVIDVRGNAITEETESGFYSGCYAMAHVQIAAFDQDGGKGVRFGLLSLIKIKDGEPLDGKKSAKEDFADILLAEENAIDDESNYNESDDGGADSGDDDMLG